MLGTLVNDFLISLFDWISTQIIALAAWLIEIINNNILSFFENDTILQLLNFSTWINLFVFGVSFIVVIVDIAEEIISEKPVYFGVVFTNAIKAFTFAVFARWIAVWSMDLANEITSAFGLSISADSFSLHADNISSTIPGLATDAVSVPILLLLAVIIAVIVFAVMSLKRFGTMLIHIFTSMLYIPDILRGDTTKMGDWLRQMISIVLTYTFIYLLFFLGCEFFYAEDIVIALACWLGMPVVSRVLNKFGWSSGSSGGFGAMAIQTGAMMIR